MLDFLANFLQDTDNFCIFVLDKAETTKICAVFCNKMIETSKICCRA